ncbi:TetR/AcrR family transcriptional regulator [Corynebacterium glyciniphilum]|uniref:TetR/AcrR family transcriptional regulator n=1 Tax=Corynebacterium glyciniphilum TaxID=1404244 RepID=UPI00264F0835|nr:TetR/AcrR family transcriptional regulator [Corynebacterium glyciniphilum]MDN6706825.1 TetR/AcrR family transcriptional regulator [Corynebacterium glyciniphilum]
MTNERESRTDRAARRRSEILTAAQNVFARDGYHGAKLTAVAAEAGCSVGTLYTYFTDRSALLGAVLDDVEEQMRHPGGRLPADRPVAEQISAANRGYLAAYRRNNRMMALMEQVSMADESVAARRARRADGFIERNARALTRYLDQGTVVGIEDPELIATALSASVSRLAYLTWVEGRFPDTDETFSRVCAAADTIWFRTLGLEEPEEPKEMEEPEDVSPRFVK